VTTLMQILIAVIVIALVAGAAFLLWREGQSRRLRRQFGPEYDRALERHSSRAEAERELRDRERRYGDLDIRPLDPAAREQHRRRWAQIQEQFVDDPRPAVEQANLLVNSVMAERGYPTRDYDEQTASLSVEHARTLDHYRRGHEIGTRASSGGNVSTEDLRQAMVHYRALFDDLLELPHDKHAPTSPTDGHRRASADRTDGNREPTERRASTSRTDGNREPTERRASTSRTDGDHEPTERTASTDRTDGNREPTERRASTDRTDGDREPAQGGSPIGDRARRLRAELRRRM
jgi:hypothetical protein